MCADWLLLSMSPSTFFFTSFAVLSLLLFSLESQTSAASISDVAKPAPIIQHAAEPPAATHRPREAYVSLLYGNFYVLPLRTLMRSLVDNCPDVASGLRERVVIVTGSTSERTVARLRLDGVSVRHIPTVRTPYATDAHFQSRFGNVMTKLAIFNMTDYKRLVFLDADSVVLRDMSDVWRCGRFCAVFINPSHFNSGMMLVTPSSVTFADMLRALPRLPSYDGGDQGFLNSYFPQLLMAPMFDPAPGGRDTSDVEFVRLPFPFHMDHSAFYPQFRWRHSRARCGGEAREEEWLGPPFVKPWLWYTYFSLDQSWVWHEYRSKLEDPFPDGSFTSTTGGILVALCYILFIPVVWRTKQLYFPIAVRLQALIPLSFAVPGRLRLLVVMICGGMCWILSIGLSFLLVPPLLAPRLAFLTFVHLRATTTFLYLVFVLGPVAVRSTSAMSSNCNAGLGFSSAVSSASSAQKVALPRIVRECAVWAIVEGSFAVVQNWFMWGIRFEYLWDRALFVFRSIALHCLLTTVMLARVGYVWISWAKKKSYSSKGR